MKSNTGPGNYAALFYGTPAADNKLPTNYWLFNPSNPSGNFKSVFTDRNNVDQPWTTEVGVTGASTSQYEGQWVHYTTVITEGSITGYINGASIGTAAKRKQQQALERICKLTSVAPIIQEMLLLRAAFKI